MIPRGRQVDEADLANETADATEANEAEANVADEAEANEAEGAANKANVAEEANVIDEIDAANKANVANEANVIEEIVGANEAIDTNEAIDAEEAEANEADEADEASVADEANSTGISGKADVTNLLLPFSLTKCSAFFSDDKVYFGIRFNVCNDKLLVARSRDELVLLFESNNKPESG